MRSTSFVTAAVAAALLAPAAGAAQIALVPKIGFYTPATDLVDAAQAGGAIVDDRGGSLAVGLALDLSLPVSPVDLRVGFDYVTNSEFKVGDGTSESTVDQQMLALTGDLVLRPLPRLIVLQPYVLAGAGIKKYSFDFKDASADSFDDENDFTVHGGLGLDLGLGPLSLVAEASDYVSWFKPEGAEDSKTQHDVFIMAGIRVGMF